MTSRQPPRLLLDDDDDVDDDDSSGTRLYALLGLSRNATQAQIKAAFRAAARRLHPDRLQGGGEEEEGKTAATAAAENAPPSSPPSGAAFAAAREAFLVLSDPARRAAYDACGAGGASWYSGRGGTGEGRREAFSPAAAAAAAAKKKPTQQEASAALLAGLGHLRCCDPRTQLVLTCGLCARPAGVSCAVCSLPLCALCCRRRHARAPGDFVGAAGGGRGGLGSSSPPRSAALAFQLHWPLVDAPGSMSRRLAARELEAKRLADAALADAAAPHSRGRQELEDVRGLRERYLSAKKGGGGGNSFEDADDDAAGEGAEGEEGEGEGRKMPSSSRTLYDPFLSRFYAWDQTSSHVVVAVRVPTGDADRGLRVGVVESSSSTSSGGDGDGVGGRASSSSSPPSFGPSSSPSRSTHRLLVAADGAPPVIDRALSRALAARSENPSSPFAPLLVRRSADNRSLLLTLTKAVPGEEWPCLFLGDSFRARCVDPPYAIREGSCGAGRGSGARGGNDDDDENDTATAPSAADDGALVEVELCPKLLPLPNWVEKRHLTVETTQEKLCVRVEGVFELVRYFWDSNGHAVLPRETTWTLEKTNHKGREDAEGVQGSKEEEAEEKTTSTLTIMLVRPSSSPRNDNRCSPRPDGRPTGRRFFACDDDFYALEDAVAAGVLSSLSLPLSLSPLGREESSSSLGAAVRAPPWRHAAAAADHGRPKRVLDAACLPLGARRQLEAILDEEEEGEEREGESSGSSSSDDSDSDDSF